MHGKNSKTPSDQKKLTYFVGLRGRSRQQNEHRNINCLDKWNLGEHGEDRTREGCLFLSACLYCINIFSRLEQKCRNVQIMLNLKDVKSTGFYPSVLSLDKGG